MRTLPFPVSAGAMISFQNLMEVTSATSRVIYVCSTIVVRVGVLSISQASTTSRHESQGSQARNVFVNAIIVNYLSRVVFDVRALNCVRFIFISAYSHCPLVLFYENRLVSFGGLVTYRYRYTSSTCLPISRLPMGLCTNVRALVRRFAMILPEVLIRANVSQGYVPLRRSIEARVMRVIRLGLSTSIGRYRVRSRVYLFLCFPARYRVLGLRIVSSNSRTINNENPCALVRNISHLKGDQTVRRTIYSNVVVAYASR